MSIESYKDLLIWKKGIEISKRIYILCTELPKDELFNLGSQIKRCSISIPSNIAEGYGRESTKDFVRFLKIARGSAFELETQLHLIKELDLVENQNLLNEINLLVTEENKMLNALIKKLSNKL